MISFSEIRNQCCNEDFKSNMELFELNRQMTRLGTTK